MERVTPVLAGPVRQPAAHPVARPERRLRGDRPADLARGVPLGLHPGHRDRVHARLRRALDRRAPRPHPGVRGPRGQAVRRHPAHRRRGRHRRHRVARVGTPRSAGSTGSTATTTSPSTSSTTSSPPPSSARCGGSSEYGWRPLDPHELTAIALLTTRFGELMGLRGLPTTYDGYLRLLRRLRARALRGQRGRASGHRGDPPGRPGRRRRGRSGPSCGGCRSR